MRCTDENEPDDRNDLKYIFRRGGLVKKGVQTQNTIRQTEILTLFVPCELDARQIGQIKGTIDRGWRFRRGDSRMKLSAH